MEEMPLTREHHREAELVGPSDDGIIADGTAGLDHHGNAGRGGGFDTVGKRVERVARGCTTDAAAVRLLGGDLARLDAVLLTRSNADGLSVFDEHDRVALDVPDESPRQFDVGPLRFGGRERRDDLPRVT